MALAFHHRSTLIDLAIKQLGRNKSQIRRNLRRGSGFDERLTEIDRVDRRAIIALNKTHNALAEKVFNLFLVEIDIFAPAVDDHANFLTRITKAVEYLEQARVTADYTMRTRLYRNFQVVFSKELPALPLFAPVYSYGVDSQVQGAQVAPLYDPSDRLATFTNWYLLTRRALEQTEVPTTSP